VASIHGLVRPQAPSASDFEAQHRGKRIRQFMTVFGATHFADRIGRPEAAPAWRTYT
jgi:hypothetical protein